MKTILWFIPMHGPEMGTGLGLEPEKMGLHITLLTVHTIQGQG